MKDEIAKIEAELDEARDSLSELKADRAKFALDAARGNATAQEALDDLSAREAMVERAIADLELALTRARVEISEADRETAERRADESFAEAKTIAAEIRADDEAIDAAFATIAAKFDARGEKITSLRKLGALDSALANKIHGPLVVQRVTAHWLRAALGRESFGIMNQHKNSLAEISDSVLAMVKRPPVAAKAA